MCHVFAILLWQLSVASPTVVDVPSSASRRLTLLPIILSGFAILISLLSLAFNSYNQYFKRPDTRLLVADDLDAWLRPDGALVFNMTVTIFNEGARYGAISRIVGKITSSQNPRGTPFRWKLFNEHKNVAKEGTSFTAYLAFAGWAHALVIPARQAVVKHVQFVTSKALELQPGVYRFEFRGFFGDVNEPRGKTSMVLELSEGQISSLQKAVWDPDTQVSKSCVRLRRRLQTVDW